MLFPARFVDRERELEALREWCSRSRVTPLYIYGPEGSGKTSSVVSLVSPHAVRLGVLEWLSRLGVDSSYVRVVDGEPKLLNRPVTSKVVERGGGFEG